MACAMRQASGCCRNRFSGFLAGMFVSLLVLFPPAIVSADKIFLKNGNVVEGRIVREDKGILYISTGGSELAIASNLIDRTERGVSADYVTQSAKKALDAANHYVSEGSVDLARKTFDAALIELAEALKGMETPPAELLELKAKLEAGRKATVPADPKSQEAEQLYQAALKELDHIAYADAFKLLQQAAVVAPERTDIQLRLAKTAKEVNKPEEAIKAYRSLLQLEPETYYAESAAPLLGLLVERGRKLVAERKADEAVDLFKDVLILQGQKAGEPVALADFLAKKTSREKESEDKVLMEVYRYADSNDLVDLAFAAVKRVEKLRPEDPEVKKLVKESEFLSKFNEALTSGDKETAAKLVAEMPEDLSNSPKISKKIEDSGKGIKETIDAGRLVLQARSALDAEDFDGAIVKAKEVIEKYATTESASEALKILTEAEREAPIKPGVVAIRALFEKRKFEDAEAAIGELTAVEKFEESRYAKEMTDLLARLPAEREAERQYDMARAQLDQKEFDAALVTLDAVAKDYPDTVSGKAAADWLAEYRGRLTREATKTKLFEENSFFAIADPSLWRAASVNDGARTAKLPPVDEKMKDAAWQIFNQMNAIDVRGAKESRIWWLHILVPLLIGAVVVIWIVMKFAPPGKGHYREPEEMTNPDPITGGGAFEASHSLSHCRMCGIKMPAEVLACPHCAAPSKLSEIERERAEAQGRAANYDPWDIRVKAKAANEFDKHFQVAKDLAQTSDVQAAIENCKRALGEDPHRKDGYVLLADLYERVGAQDDAAKCYREILLIDPAEVVVRQKIESLLSLSSQPLELGNVVILLSVAAWWLIFWLIMGIDPTGLLVRLGLCIAGGVLTVYYWKESQKNRKMPVEATKRGSPDVHRPLATEALNYTSQSKQAKILAQSISEHTGIDVPTLSAARVYFVIILSLALLAAMVAIAWLNRTPWVLLGWPAGVLLFVFLIEIYPRVYTAHVVLRHIFEETSSPWVDPHRPFKPNNQEVKGEFLIRAYKEFPLRWALNPHPYPPTRQGVLDSLQQTMNRHWACHRFYEGLHVVRDIDIPIPAGMRALLGGLVLLLVVAVLSASSIYYVQSSAKERYETSIKIGYLSLLDGDLAKARSSFFEAIIANPKPALPHLYLAHSDSSAGLVNSAERAFRAAIKRAGNIAVIRNDYGNFLQRQGRLKEAIQQYIAALEIDPNNADVLNNLGSGYFKIKEYEKASKQLEEAVRVDSAHPRAYTTLGLAYEAMGDWPKAKMAFERAVEIAPELPYTQVAKDRLELGEPDSQKPLTLDGVTAE